MEHRVTNWEVNYSRIRLSRKLLPELQSILGKRFTISLEDLAIPERTFSKNLVITVNPKFARRLRVGSTYRLEIIGLTELRLVLKDNDQTGCHQ